MNEYLNQAFGGAFLAERNRNLYQKIVWDISVRNAYQFDQTNRVVTFTNHDLGLEVRCRPDIVGTFNFEDKTFLWADENPSVEKGLSALCTEFRKSLPADLNLRKFESTIDLNAKILSAFCFSSDAEGSYYVRQGSAMIYFTLNDIRPVAK